METTPSTLKKLRAVLDEEVTGSIPVSSTPAFGGIHQE